MACLMLENVIVKDNILEEDRYKYLFTVERVNELVNNGITFRDAYRQVAGEVENGAHSFLFRRNNE